MHCSVVFLCTDCHRKSMGIQGHVCFSVQLVSAALCILTSTFVEKLSVLEHVYMQLTKTHNTQKTCGVWKETAGLVIVGKV